MRPLTKPAAINQPFPKIPLLLLALWLVVNLLQAGLTPLDPDETYYWMYAGRLDWGYFDHPPAVAVLIALGKDWLPGALGLRFGHVLASAATVAGMWFLLDRPTGRLLWVAAALVFAQPFLNVYGFIATPDGPLLLFTVLYLLAYRRFLRTPDLLSGALWGLTMAGLLYSKYHGVMLIFFSVLPNLLWLLRRPGAWVAALGGAALFVPHLHWQLVNDFPSFRYHLNGRNDAYQFKYTTEYLLNQLLIFSPLLVPFYVKTMGRGRRMPGKFSEAGNADPAFFRANYWLVLGFLVFFLYTTTKGGTEAQWTALLSMPLCYLTFTLARDHFTDWQPWLKRLGLATIIILVIARLLLIAPRDWLPFAKPFDHQPWAERLAERADGLPVMVQNSYRFASLYEFYTGNPAWTFTDVQYRQNQYDLWTADTVFHNKSVYLLGQGSWDRPEAQPFRTQKRDMLTQRVDEFQVMKGLQLTTVDEFPDTIRRGQLYSLTLTAQAPYREISLRAGNLSLSPHITIHYAEEEMRFWELERGEVYPVIRPGQLTGLFRGAFRTFNDSPLGPAEIEFGLAYAGMPPIRGQSVRYPIVVVK